MRGTFSENQGDMDLSTFKKLIPALPQIKFLNLTGLGEPLMNASLFEIIKIAKELLPENSEIGFTTNAMLICEKTAQAIVSSKIDKLVISIDGIKPETYGYIRRGGNFKKIKESIDFINQYKEKIKTSKPKLGLEFVVMKRNLDELPLAVNFAKENKIEFIIVSHLLPYTEEMLNEVSFEMLSQASIDIFQKAMKRARTEGVNLKNYYNFSFFRKEMVTKEYEQKLNSVINDAYSEAASHDIFLNLRKLFERDEKTLAKERDIFAATKKIADKLNIELSLPPINSDVKRECKFVKNRTAFISWDGEVKPCSRLMHSHKFHLDSTSREVYPLSLGNINDKSLEKIWNSKKFVELRACVDKFTYPHCLECPAYGSCGFLDRFEGDCFGNDEPCGDCLWSRNLMQCL
ncbi:MAG: hypothetical protein A3C43_10915 [Candidatus Schekmanbacteria bacterium RIFCSPHIGHO2_02_FULL_38_11]|uniref:Radical SAM core domain-containing protein n=1 Tax=Candidatus Schekmanbacteria bacterium RIFCSPLOWO2_12_FULL_38_15 TaxID=1817883 RepID=A0A1F7SGU2_9BACT|nr:MAG: hypothetical protein A2043_00090 [Candidatus Schekmanbacteria bacterium GWA2_38_9]OGL49649.1 MAG: hypothetical protein A3H37_01245 [Candidatus Schekmanbacteria bacterium RIFCSPLOWO2_02_FULL_38_14]OGL50371.1 MAG: hypothetical protein A3C43_10915 [Candidatus Schekmanbacteria bacterium RIFCSPHIGHO2_02_FULL_38_11]OGL53002.1 MAG: hypothetical protein A3G31_08800 [Candidatus Schekmanbacteria bacterium RIFCSPLOWO2_12_FULL_38_15]